MTSCRKGRQADPSQSGIMEEMMEETLDSVDADEELEEEADAEVDKVLFELTDGKLGQAGKVGSDLPVSVYASYLYLGGWVLKAKAQKEDEEESEEEMARMQREMRELLSN